MRWNDASMSFSVALALAAMHSKQRGRSRIRDVTSAARSAIRFVARRS